MNKKYMFIYILFLVCIVLQSVSAAEVEVITNKDYLKIIKEVDSLKIINDTIRQETSLSYTPNIKDSLNCTIYKYNDRGELENIKDNLEVESIDSKYRFYVNSTSLTWDKYRYTCQASYNIEQYGSDQFELLGQDRTTLNFHKQCDAKEYSYSTEEVYSEEWDALINVTTATVINSANCSYEVSENRIDVDFFATDLDPELDSDTYLLEDVTGQVQCNVGGFCHDYQSKWDISGISGNILNAQLCTYVNSLTSTLNNADVEVITDQTWTESISTTTFNAQSTTNRSNAVTLNNTDTTGQYTCANITNQLQYGVDQGWSNLTIRMWHNTGGLEDVASPASAILDATTSQIGADGTFFGYQGWNTDTREGTNKPFLEYEATDTSGPTFTLINPLNNTYYNDNSTIPFINFSVTDDSGVSHCSYSFDGGATNSSPDSTCANFTAQSFEGQNDVLLYANDTLNNNATYNLTYFLDLTNSSVTLVSPPDTQSNTTATHSFNATMTDNINFKNATFEIWDSGNNLVKNYTIDITGTSNATNYTYTIPSAGTYEWNYYVCDQGSNCVYATSNFTITYSAISIGLVWESHSGNDNISQNRSNSISFNLSCSGADCGNINSTLYYVVESGGIENTVYDYNYDVADLYEDSGGAEGKHFNAIKWENISGLGLSGITVAEVCLYIETKDLSPDNDIRVYYMPNQNWNEGIGGIYNETRTNETNKTLSSTTDNTYSCFDVMTQLNESIAQGDTNFSIAFFDPDHEPFTTGLVTDNGGLIFGAQHASPEGYDFEDRENSLASNNRPYLNISSDTTSIDYVIINTSAGDKPLYTTSNATQMFNLSQDESVIITWEVNATGAIDEEYGIYAIANMTLNLTQSNQTVTYNFSIQEFVDTTPPVVTLTLPENATTSSTSVIFVGNFTDDENLQNATLYVWNSSGDLYYNETVNVTGVSNSTSIETSVDNSNNYEWNYLVYDVAGNSAWANSNFTFESAVVCTKNPESGCIIDSSLDINDTTHLVNDIGTGALSFSVNDVYVNLNSSVLTGNTSGYGFLVNGYSNINISNGSIGSFNSAFFVNNSQNIRISDVTFSDVIFGIRFGDSASSVILDNYSLSVLTIYGLSANDLNITDVSIDSITGARLRSGTRIGSGNDFLVLRTIFDKNMVVRQ